MTLIPDEERKGDMNTSGGKGGIKEQTNEENMHLYTNLPILSSGWLHYHSESQQPLLMVLFWTRLSPGFHSKRKYYMKDRKTTGMI